MDIKIKAQELLDLIPDDKLLALSAETTVDKGVKKFSGRLFFKLLLYSILQTERLSLRTIERFFNSRPFRFLAGVHPQEEATRHSSISDRLEHVKVEFFQKVFAFTCDELAQGQGVSLPERQKIKRFDSTIVSLSSKLLHFGMSNDCAGKGRTNGLHQLKFTIGFDGLLPETIRFHTEQNYLNENRALSEAILSQRSPREGVTVFDRGLRGRKTFALLADNNVRFVTRADVFPTHEELGRRSVDGVQTDTLDLLEDLDVYLFSTAGKVKTPLRMIIAQKKSDGEPLCFLTNIPELPASEITEIYKKRWEIEVFFRFIKQEMNFSHLVSRTRNGIEVMCYLTMIAAMLILVYRKKNGLAGYKHVKAQFAQDLEDSLVEEIVILCGGDPAKINQYPLRP